MAELKLDEQDIFEVIGTQRAMRRLKPDPVPEELIRKVIWGATRAPSGGNRQPWRFLVVTDAGKRAELGRIYSEVWEQYAKQGYTGTDPRMTPEAQESNDKVVRSAQYLADHMADVPVLILACAFSQGTVNAGIAEGASIYPAVQNLMLSARALGLGTALTTLHRWKQDETRAVVGMPPTVEIAAVIPLGWPKGKFGAGFRQPVEDVTYWDTWGTKRK